MGGGGCLGCCLGLGGSFEGLSRSDGLLDVHILRLQGHGLGAIGSNDHISQTTFCPSVGGLTINLAILSLVGG